MQKKQQKSNPPKQSWVADACFLLSSPHQQDKARRASGQWGAGDGQELGVATFLVISCFLQNE